MWNEGKGSKAGHVRAFQYNSSTQEWAQMGQDLDAEASGDRFGTSVSLSNDGNVLAAGSRRNNGSGADAGHVRVYQYSSAILDWAQLGQDIDAEAKGDWFGTSVSLNSAGNVFAAGGIRSDGRGTKSGHVRVYQYSTIRLSWTRVGPDIDGEAAKDLSGGSVSLSGDGTAVAIGANGNSDNGENSGHARVYTLN